MVEGRREVAGWPGRLNRALLVLYPSLLSLPIGVVSLRSASMLILRNSFKDRKGPGSDLKESVYYFAFLQRSSVSTYPWPTQKPGSVGWSLAPWAA
jgi:hypothetical protein